VSCQRLVCLRCLGNLGFRACSTRQPFVWNGAYGYAWIPEVSLYHVGARAYDPRTARWLQRDPSDADSGDPNLYRYCGNDPINYHDPDGKQEHCSVTCSRGRAEIVKMALYQSRGHSLQKQARLKTPSLRFPLLAGGTEPVRGSPREAGGTCRRGAIVNSARAIGIRRSAANRLLALNSVVELFRKTLSAPYFSSTASRKVQQNRYQH